MIRSVKLIKPNLYQKQAFVVALAVFVIHSQFSLISLSKIGNCFENKFLLR